MANLPDGKSGDRDRRGDGARRCFSAGGTLERAKAVQWCFASLNSVKRGQLEAIVNNLHVRPVRLRAC